MLEPLANSVLSSILSSGRPLTAYAPVSHSALRMVTRSSNLSFPSDFFTPHPRRFKGKERDLSDHECGACEDGSSSLCPGETAISQLDPRHKHLPRPLVACPHQIRRSSSPRFYTDPSRPHLPPSLHPWSRNADCHQRRHSSTRPDPAPPPIPDITPYRDKILDILSTDAPFNVDDAWDTYQSFHTFSDSRSSPLTDDQLLHFASRILSTVQGPLDSLDHPPLWSLWSIRIRGLLTDIQHRFDSENVSEPTQQNWHALMARDYALAGSFTHAINHARQLVRHPSKLQKFGQLRRLFETYETICIAMSHHLLPTAVLDLIVEEWSVVGHYLLHHWADATPPPVRHRLGSFRDVVFRIVSHIQRPTQVMRDLANTLSAERRQLTVEVYIEILCRMDLGEDALIVFQEALLQKLQVPFRLKLLIVKALARSRSYEVGNTFYTTLPEQVRNDVEKRHLLTTGLHLFATQGLVDHAQDCFSRLKHAGWVGTSEIATLLHLYGVCGDVENAVKVFEEYFTPESMHQPSVFHFSAVIYAHSQRSDYDGMNAWLEKMVQAGVSPDKYVYNIILTSLATRGDVQSMKAILDQMRSSGMSPSRVDYTTIITQLGRLKDPEAADLIYKRAMKEGIIPDRQMMTALMDAHVEAASWKGAITAFDFMQQSTTKGIRLSIEVYNTLLKAYVLVGSPFRVVSKLFQRLEKVDVRPDARTFALLIQSACDAGLMRTATDLFSEMEKLSEQWQTGIHVEVYVLTVIMAGYLRLKDKLRAKAVFDDMLRRGVDPTSVTYGLIIRAYGNERSDKSIAIAEDFLSDLMEHEERRWDQRRGTRGNTLNHVYSPLMNAYAHRQNPEEVERVFEQMLEAGGEATLGTLTTLLDAHRRKGNIESVKEVWEQLVELSKRFMNEAAPLFQGDETLPNPGRFKNLLCVPLSIYVDALSAAGLHLEIATVWRELQSQGLTFDSHNWNHLAVALLRAGEPERAFEIIEKVILPYRKQTFELVKRPDSPRSPLITDLPPPEEGDPDPARPPYQSPLHSGKRRAVTLSLISRKSRPWMLEQKDDDFAHSLNILYQVSPAWNIWRPHNITLSLLSRTLAHLQNGRIIQPTTAMHSGLSPMSGPVEEEELEKQTRMAGKILGRIYDNYPLAVQSVKDYEFWQRQGAGDSGKTSSNDSRGGRRDKKGGGGGMAKGRGRGSRKYRHSS